MKTTKASLLVPSMWSSLRDSGNAWAIVTIWLTALLFTVWSLSRLPSFIHAQNTAQSSEQAQVTLKRLSLVQSPVDEGTLKKTADYLKTLYPGIEASVQAGKLVITAPVVSSYEEWISAVAGVVTLSPQYEWKLVSLCGGDGCAPSLNASLEPIHRQWQLQ